MFAFLISSTTWIIIDALFLVHKLGLESSLDILPPEEELVATVNIKSVPGVSCARFITPETVCDAVTGIDPLALIWSIKIFPANYIDKNLKNGYGVIMDDIVAGIYTIFTLMILNVFI